MGIAARVYMDIMVVRLEEPLPADDAGLESFRDNLLEVIDGVPESILVDLRSVKRMSSRQLQALLMAFLGVRSWACLAE